MSKRVLHVVTNVDQYEDGTPTGLWLSELVHVYDQLDEHGVDQVIASPRGGRSPIEPKSLLPVVCDGATKARYEDPDFMSKLEHTVPLTEVSFHDFDAVYLPGGHGAMYDFAESVELARGLESMAARGAIIASVCHGPAGLLQANNPDGTPFISGRRVTGYSWLEEVAAGVASRVPFNLEQHLQDLGAEYEKNPIPLGPKAVCDGNLITGQNPTSSKRVGAYLLEALGLSNRTEVVSKPSAALATLAERPEPRYALIGMVAVGVTAALARMLTRRRR